MSQKISHLIRSIKIVNTLWVPAIMLYFIDNVGVTKSFGVPLAFNRIIDPFISMIVKIVFLSWIWGLIIETLTGESYIGHLKNFKYNLKNGWRVPLILILIPQTVFFIIYILTGPDVFSLAFLNNFFYVFISYWAAGEFIKIKYKHILSHQFKDYVCSWQLLFYGIFFFVISMLLYLIDTKMSSISFIQSMSELFIIQFQFLTFTIFSSLIISAYPEIVKNFQSSKNLILINPPAGSIIMESFSPVLIRRYPSFFTVLQALTPPEYRIIEYNRIIWREHFYQGNALVAISCVTTNSASAYHLAREFRRRGSKVVLGGQHVTFFPKEALEFCDSVVIGPAESVWAQIVHDYENNDLKPTYHGHYSENESAQVLKFLKDSPVEIVRDCLQISPSCKFKCFFCCAPNLTEESKPNKLVDEILPLLQKSANNFKPMVFIDNNIYNNPTYFKGLLRAMIPLKTQWGGSTTIDIAKDDETIGLLKESKCYQLLIGYEVGTHSNVENIKGKFALAKNYLSLTNKLKKAGILIQGQFTFGYPRDTMASLINLWKFCFKLSPAHTILMYLTPLPGAPYFEECIREEKLINLNWRNYDLQRQVVETPHLKNSWFLQFGFSLIVSIFYLTTSFTGRCVLLIIVIMEFIYYSIK